MLQCADPCLDPTQQLHIMAHNCIFALTDSAAPHFHRELSAELQPERSYSSCLLCQTAFQDCLVRLSLGPGSSSWHFRSNMLYVWTFMPWRVGSML